MKSFILDGVKFIENTKIIKRRRLIGKFVPQSKIYCLITRTDSKFFRIIDVNYIEFNYIDNKVYSLLSYENKVISTTDLNKVIFSTNKDFLENKLQEIKFTYDLFK